tara:strand:- start:16 stop:267 length:252 start_codon:yes stop_codon:yes gene_type:complete
VENLSPVLFWNVILTLVFAPMFYSIRQNADETKRLNILVSKTREEMATNYISRTTFDADIGRILNILEKMERKIDKLFEGESK